PSDCANATSGFLTPCHRQGSGGTVVRARNPTGRPGFRRPAAVLGGQAVRDRARRSAGQEWSSRFLACSRTGEDGGVPHAPHGIQEVEGSTPFGSTLSNLRSVLARGTTCAGRPRVRAATPDSGAGHRAR